MNEYERIARVIRYLDAHHAGQPDLATLADQAGCSQFHFHRLFSTWAGITPKEFLQCLTHSHARELLDRGRSVLASSIDAGLSGPGRLHDLCVKLDAATPGEVKAGGEGLSMTFGFAESPFGRCLLAESPRGICYLAFADPGDGQAVLSGLKDCWPRAALQRDDAAAGRLSREVFRQQDATGKRRRTLRAFVQGSAFQVRVWRALLQIPPGTLVSYGQLAAALNRPAAARTVGTAIGRNPLAFLIPCHRVIRETGVLSGYRWGRDCKRAIVARESSTGPGGGNILPVAPRAPVSLEVTMNPAAAPGD